MQEISKSRWVPIALLLRPQGRRGELLAEPLSDLPELFSTAHDLVLGSGTPPAPLPGAPSLLLQEHWFPTGKNTGRIVLKLSNCDSISDAEALAGKHILIASEHLPSLAPDTFFVGDLVGCTVLNGEAIIGVIDGLDFPTGPDGRTRLEDVAPLLSVLLLSAADNPDAEPVLIPFVRAWLDTVDISGRRIVMHLPDGLLASSSEDPTQT